VGEREHHEADDRSRQAEDQDRPAAVPVGKIAKGRRGDELAERKHREQEADDQRRGAERFGVERQQGNDDPEPDEVDEDR
jgi:hypothetical protein